MSSKSGVEPARRWRWFAFHQSLAGRLTAWYTLSTFALVLAITVISYSALVKTFDTEADGFLSDITDNLEKRLHNDPEGIDELKKEIEFERSAHQYYRVYARLLDDQGKILVQTSAMPKQLGPDVFPAPVRYDPALDPPGIDVLTRIGHPYRASTVRITLVSKPQKVTRILEVACDRKHMARILIVYRRNLYLFLSIALLACTVIGYFVAHRGIRPVGQITAAARRVRSTTLHERIETQGLPSELTSLAGTFNEMLDRLEDSFRRLSQFSADIAHELRTPVNNLRGEVEVALGKARTLEEYRDTLGSTLEECERLSGMIDRLLFIARSESPETRLDVEKVDIAIELEAIREYYDAAAHEGGVMLQLEAPNGSTAEINRVLFRGAIGNLVSNAVAHTPGGGMVQISAKTEPGTVRVDVTDTGSGIPPEHLPHIFDRFYRVDGARSTSQGGVGLGLAIVRTIAKMHNAEIRVASTLGKGTCIGIVFPRIRARPNAEESTKLLADETMVVRK